MNIRLKLYNLLVESDPYVRDRFMRYKHGLTLDGFSGKVHKVVNLAFCYFRRWILQDGIEKDNLPYLKGTESSLCSGKSPEQLARELDAYDVVSFDIFDTLLLRPFAVPVDLFHIVGEELDYMNYAVLRRDMEVLCRNKQVKNGGSDEVVLDQVYELMERQIGVPAKHGMETELCVESKLLYANPYMKQVFDILQSKGKRIIVTSDTYFTSDFIRPLLEKNGYQGIEKIFLSCEHGCGKHNGGLFEKAKTYLGSGISLAHIGDNAHSDVIMARRKEISAFYYPNVNLSGVEYRTVKQSRIVGSAYAGTINAILHNGSDKYTPFYEYGLIFGGLFVAGYCNFIHEYVKNNQIDRVLFLSRDGDILKQAYDLLYPGNDSRYVYWSRSSAAKLGADYFRFDCLSRYLFNKISHKQTVGEVLDAMEIGSLPEILLCHSGLSREDLFDEDTCEQLERSILDNWQAVLQCYENSHVAAKFYFNEVLEGCRSACTVDIGWAGSGGVILSHLIEKKWGINCKLTGLIAGTCSPNTNQPDVTEALLQSGKVSAYLFSQSHNRDYWESYDPAEKGHVLFFEALLASPTPGFSGFELSDSGGYSLRFHNQDERTKQNARETQAGILHFVREYSSRFAKYPYMLNISGSDAFAPFAAAFGKNGAYFRRLFHDSVFEPDVSGKIRSIDEIAKP